MQMTLGCSLGGIVLLCVAACARNDNAVVVRSMPELVDSITIDVINDHYYEARVYAVYAGGARHALGTVRSNHREEGIAIPWRARSLAFEVHLVVGFESYLSHEISVERGDYIQLRVPQNIRASGSFTRLPSRRRHGDASRSTPTHFCTVPKRLVENTLTAVGYARPTASIGT
jgi:hypothetical protein